MTKHPDRIPYDNWINSQLSIARFYGGCVLNGVTYYVDWEGCPGYKEDPDPEAEGKVWKPDLVKVKK